jgi:hypothetical protein
MNLLRIFILIVFSIVIKSSSAQEVTMFPGFFVIEYYQDDVRISNKTFKNLMLDNPASNMYYKKSILFYRLSLASASTEFAFLILLVNSNSLNSATNMLLGVAGTAAFSLIFSQSSNFFKKKAILNYNKSLESNSLYIGPTTNGVGLVYSF